MNHINSIILEGDLEADPIFLSNQNSEDSYCHFTIQSIRNTKKNKIPQEETSSFTVYTQKELANSCSEQLKKGRGVRVVGRLVEKQQNTAVDLPPIYVKAEYVEFKPMIQNA